MCAILVLEVDYIRRTEVSVPTAVRSTILGGLVLSIRLRGCEVGRCSRCHCRVSWVCWGFTGVVVMAVRGKVNLSLPLSRDWSWRAGYKRKQYAIMAPIFFESFKSGDSPGGSSLRGLKGFPSTTQQRGCSKAFFSYRKSVRHAHHASEPTAD